MSRQIDGCLAAFRMSATRGIHRPRQSSEGRGRRPLGCLHPRLAGSGSSWTWHTVMILELKLKQIIQSLVHSEQTASPVPRGYSSLQRQCVRSIYRDTFYRQLPSPVWASLTAESSLSLGTLWTGLHQLLQESLKHWAAQIVICFRCWKSESKVSARVVSPEPSLLSLGVAAAFSPCLHRDFPLTSLIGLWPP